MGFQIHILGLWVGSAKHILAAMYAIHKKWSLDILCLRPPAVVQGCVFDSVSPLPCGAVLCHPTTSWSFLQNSEHEPFPMFPMSFLFSSRALSSVLFLCSDSAAQGSGRNVFYLSEQQEAKHTNWNRPQPKQCSLAVQFSPTPIKDPIRDSNIKILLKNPASNNDETQQVELKPSLTLLHCAACEFPHHSPMLHWQQTQQFRNHQIMITYFSFLFWALSSHSATPTCKESSSELSHCHAQTQARFGFPESSLASTS